MTDGRLELNARCTCTMEKIGKVWIAPEGDYKKPDKDCSDCNGTGFRLAAIPFHKVEALWYAQCPQCGEVNGGHIQYKGEQPPDADSDPLGPPSCFNDECRKKGIKCIWKKDAETIPEQN